MKRKLKDLCLGYTKNIAQKELDDLNGDYEIYGASGLIKKIDYYISEVPYIGIVKDGSGVGRVNSYPAKSSLIGTMQYIVPNEDIDLRFLMYGLRSLNLGNLYRGAAIPHIYFKDYKEFELNVPAFPEQQKIVTELDTIQSAIDNKKQQLSLLDEVVESQFIEIFGDPIFNPMGWGVCELDELADIISGITKGRKTKETTFMEVPYMAVSNVKAGYIDWTTLKTIEATKSEIEMYRLKENDVLMTEGGDPDKVGRGALLTHVPDNCIHQNHVFRVRLFDMNPIYFSQYLQHSKSKEYFLNCAKQTTGIASINMSQLKKLPVNVPPLNLQNKFATFVQQIDKSKSIVKQQIADLQELLDSKMQKYFS